MNLLGRYKDRAGDSFRLGQFHDDLIKNGSLPVSVVEWMLLDDPTAIHQVAKGIRVSGSLHSTPKLQDCWTP